MHLFVGDQLSVIKQQNGGSELSWKEMFNWKLTIISQGELFLINKAACAKINFD